MKKVVIIYGAPSKISRLQGITEYFIQALAANNIEVNVIYPQDLPANALLYADFTNEEIKQAVQLVEAADGVIIASPVYKAAYSGFLKVFLDMLPQRGLEHKVALPIMVGGTLAHLLAIDYALRPVLSALSNTHTLQGVYALDSWITKSESGSYIISEELEERLQISVNKLISELK